MIKHIDYIDRTKGLLILLVIIGHTFISGFFHDLIYTFHMPAFFIISGVLMNYSSSLKKPLRSVIFSKIYTLIIPYLFFEIIGIVYHFIANGTLQNPIGYIYDIITMHCYNIVDWFLPTLFFAELLFIFLRKISNNYILISFGILAILLSGILNFIIFNRILLAFAFICFGYYSHKVFAWNNQIVFVLSIAVTIIVTLINGSSDINSWNYKYYPIFLIGAITGTYFIIQLCKYFNFRLQYFGKNSLVIMGTHLPLLWGVEKILFHNVNDLLAHQLALSGIIVIILEFPTIFVLNKYLPILIGKHYGRQVTITN